MRSYTWYDCSCSCWEVNWSYFLNQYEQKWQYLWRLTRAYADAHDLAGDLQEKKIYAETGTNFSFTLYIVKFRTIINLFVTLTSSHVYIHYNANTGPHAHTTLYTDRRSAVLIGYWWVVNTDYHCELVRCHVVLVTWSEAFRSMISSLFSPYLMNLLNSELLLLCTHFTTIGSLSRRRVIWTIQLLSCFW